MDNFALLGQPRRPWIDPDSLKASFLEISARTHPDRLRAAAPSEQEAATRHYAELNAAHTCLREPKQRLLHLLELELGAPPANVQDVAPGAMELFFQTGTLCREADGILAGKAGAASPLLQAQWFEKGLQCAERLNVLQDQIHLRRDGILEELKTMNAAWDAAPPPGSPTRAAALPLRRLEELGRELSFLTRWSAQIHERLARLSF